MAGHASNWTKMSGGPMKGQSVYVSKATAIAAGGRDAVLSALRAGDKATIANVQANQPRGVARRALRTPAAQAPRVPVVGTRVPAAQSVGTEGWNAGRTRQAIADVLTDPRADTRRRLEQYRTQTAPPSRPGENLDDAAMDWSITLSDAMENVREVSGLLEDAGRRSDLITKVDALTDELLKISFYGARNNVAQNNRSGDYNVNQGYRSLVENNPKQLSSLLARSNRLLREMKLALLDTEDRATRRERETARKTQIASGQGVIPGFDLPARTQPRTASRDQAAAVRTAIDDAIGMWEARNPRPVLPSRARAAQRAQYENRLEQWNGDRQSVMTRATREALRRFGNG